MRKTKNRFSPLIKQGRKKRVIVAMSGGVDSSVAAALLKRAGFNVIGIFMKFWAPPTFDGLIGSWNRCCSPEAEKRAREVALTLNIPFYVLRFEKEFKKRIVDYFLAGYKAGITPNPCVVCNKEIKFGLLLNKALSLRADFIATGHYALKREIKNQKSKIKNHKLLRAKDKNKDQSYFLWMLSQDQLKHILFPIGDYTKVQVRSLARNFKLSVSEIPESMEICFIQTTINDFLSRYLKPKPGKIVDKKGKILGKHEGLHFFTIGQRKGIKLAGGPFYVLNKDLKENLLIVTKNEKDLYKKELKIKNVNWISGKMPKFPLKIKAKIRYRHKAASATIYPKLLTTNYKLLFDRPQRAITPGQSVVFYLPADFVGRRQLRRPKAEASAKAGQNQELLGGGIIC